MRVVYVTTLGYTGPVVHLLDLLPHLGDLGVDAFVCCADDEVAHMARRRGVGAAVAPLRHKYDLPGLARLVPLLRGVELVHTHDRRAGLLARAAARALGVPCVHTLHGLHDEVAGMVGSDAVPRLRPLQRAWLLGLYPRLEGLLARTGAVIVPSRALASFITARGIPSDRVRVIPSGTEVIATAPPPTRQPPVVGTAAALIERKGIDVLLEAWARLQRPARLVVFGGGERAAELQALARRLEVEVDWRGEVAEARKHLRELDVFVLPTRGDNLPMALLEAMACALPVVASAVGGIPEAVEHGRSGLLVPPEDPEALAAALRQLLDDPGLRARLGTEAARTVATRFSPRAAARLTVELYGELLHRCG